MHAVAAAEHVGAAAVHAGDAVGHAACLWVAIFWASWSFFCLWGGFDKGLCQVHSEVLLAISKVPPLVVVVAFGMKAQQWDVCF